MREWLSPYPIENYKRQAQGRMKVPAVGIRGKLISENKNEVFLDELNLIEEYICGLFSVRTEVTQRFDNLFKNEEISNQFKRLSTITKLGKLWIDNNDHVLALEIQDIHFEAKNRYNQISKNREKSLINSIFVDRNPWDMDIETPLTDFQVKYGMFKKKSMTPEMISFCEFFENTIPSVMGVGEFGITVSGWDINEMEVPNDFICMLAERYNEIILLVETKKSLVRFVRAIRYNSVRGNFS